MRVRCLPVFTALLFAAAPARGDDIPTPDEPTRPDLPDERQVPSAVPPRAVPVVRESAGVSRETLVAETLAATAPSEAPVPDAFRPGVYLGGTAGLGAPAGHAVAGLVGLQLHPLASLEIYGGLGGAFGPALAGGARIYPVHGRGWALSLAGFYSVNFTPGPASSTGDPGDPVTSRWANAELGAELRNTPGLGLRVALGWTWLLNGEDFTHPSTPNAVFHTSGPLVDLPDARAAAREGHGISFLYVHLDYFYTAPF